MALRWMAQAEDKVHGMRFIERRSADASYQMKIASESRTVCSLTVVLSNLGRRTEYKSIGMRKGAG